MSTRRKRLAKALAAILDCGHQDALNRIEAAGAAGALPEHLDQAGMLAALITLSESSPRTGARTSAARPGGADAHEELHVRPWIPWYAVSDPSYVPWYVAHTDRRAITDTALSALADQFRPESDEITDEWQSFLEKNGYRSLNSPWEAGAYILPESVETGSDEPDEDELDGKCEHCDRELNSETGRDSDGSPRCDDHDPNHRHHLPLEP